MNTATPEIYTLSLHDALPICGKDVAELGNRVVRAIRERHFYIFTHPETRALVEQRFAQMLAGFDDAASLDRKSTRLNSSHPSISYAVFCLKKKKEKNSRNSEN